MIDSHLYVAGGLSSDNGKDIELSACERYDKLTNKWSDLPMLPSKGFSMSLIAVHSRYVFGFGLTS